MSRIPACRVITGNPWPGGRVRSGPAAHHGADAAETASAHKDESGRLERSWLGVWVICAAQTKSGLRRVIGAYRVQVDRHFDRIA
jgi:hypothetical protein